MSIIGKVSGEILGKVVSLGLERLASWLETKATVKDSLTPRPVDIAIATKSAVSADREGKIASERAKKPSECLHPQARCWHPEQAGPWVKQCPDCGRYVAADTRANVEEMWTRAVVGPIQRNRRLGDYGPSE